MVVFIDKDIHKEAKKKADTVYKKPSAYKSGYIVQLYKKMGGKFKDDKKGKPLKRWYKEKWTDIGNVYDGFNLDHYPLYRPTVRVNKETPKTFSEIPLKRLVQQYNTKQKIKGNKNLEKF